MAVVFAVLAVFLAVEGAEAFCVYNNTDKLMNVCQASGSSGAKGLKEDIGPGGNACCNWQNKDCNKEGKRDSIVTFNVKKLEVWSVCENFPIQAGGTLTIEGEKGNYKCVRHDY